MTLGMEQAVKSAGLTGKVKLIGNGASVPGVAAVERGPLVCHSREPSVHRGLPRREVRDHGSQGNAALEDPAFRR